MLSEIMRPGGVTGTTGRAKRGVPWIAAIGGGQQKILAPPVIAALKAATK